GLGRIARLVRDCRAWFRVGLPPEDVPRLALKHSADRVEGGEAHGLRAAVLEHCDVGGGDAGGIRELRDGHFAPRQLHIDVDDDGHQTTSASSPSRVVAWRSSPRMTTTSSDTVRPTVAVAKSASTTTGGPAWISTVR